MSPGPATTRHEARRHALQVLYEADLRGRDVGAVLDDPGAVIDGVDGDDEPSVPIAPFTRALARGTWDARTELDAVIETYATGWSVRRMPVVDRNILRLGTYELRHTDTPVAVVIDEAVELAKELSTDDSPRFVNGVLARIASVEDTAEEIA